VHLSLAQALAGAVVGIAIGLTGVGGGALLTPVTVLLFNVPPAVAVSSDLVVSLIIKPVGSAVHLRRGKPRLDVVRWLMAGSIPAAFAGVLILQLLGDRTSAALKPMLGVALVLAAGAIIAKALIMRARTAQGPDGAGLERARSSRAVRPVATVAIGAIGGLLVGITSVGSGSLMLVALALLYPDLSTRELVGTDLIQAVPLVASATLGHLMFGSVDFHLATSVLLGALPGVYLGARLSSRAPDRVVRPVLATVLAGSGLKLLGV
jgi:uncharacterized membrane protein YfcA